MEDNIDDFGREGSEEAGLVCETCEYYQQNIYKVNCLLRTDLSDEEYEKTRELLGSLIQVQLRHQREHTA